MFLDGTHKVVNGNSGLQKSRPNTVTIMARINKIVEKNYDKAPHLTHSIILDGGRADLKLLLSNMSHSLLQKMVNVDMQWIGISPISQLAK